MKDKSTNKTLNFAGKNSSIIPVKNPGIISYISKHFDEYRSSEGLILKLFLFITKRYQNLNLDTFLGQEWIDIDIDEFAKSSKMNKDYLLEKTFNCKPPYTPLHITELGNKYRGGIPFEVSQWNEKHKANYKKVLATTEFIYDTVLTDALYKMWKQRINTESNTLGPLVDNVWQKYYSLKGFFILQQLRILTEKKQRGSKVIKIQVKLSDELISQIHLFFFLTKSEEHQELTASSKKYTYDTKLYLLLSHHRHAHFFNTSDPKTEKQPCSLSFAMVCNFLGLRFKEEEGDKEGHWRYKEARKSITAKLNKLLKASKIIYKFNIDKIKDNKYPDIHLFFNRPDDSEKSIVESFLKNREDICVQKWLSFYYRNNVLIPGVQPWDNTTTDESEILEKYCNQEYYTQWLSNKNLHRKRKKEAITAAFVELWGNEEKYAFPIEKKLKEASKAAEIRLKESKQPLLEARDWSRDDIINTLEKCFARAFKCFVKGTHISKKVPASYTVEMLKQIPKSPIYLYVFLKHPDFKTKELPSYIKNINIIQAKALEYKFGEEKNALWTYCKDFLKADSLIVDLDKETQKQINRMSIESLEIGRNTLVMNAPYYSEELELLIEKLSKSANINIELKK